MKKLIKSLDKEEDAFQFIRNKFPHISDVKIDAGILNRPPIIELIRDIDFDFCMNNYLHGEDRKSWNTNK